MRAQIVNALRDAGFKVELAAGEADIHISQEAVKYNGDVHVLMQDSDFYIRRGVSHVLRP